MPSPTIRPVRPDDLPQLCALIAGLASHHGDTPAVTEASLSRDLFAALPWLEVLVSDQAGLLADYVALTRLVQLQNGRRGMDMHHLFVLPAWRNRGLGTALVQAARDQATTLGCGYMTVSSHPQNFAAQGFYPKLGFQPRDGGARRFAIDLAP